MRIACSVKFFYYHRCMCGAPNCRGTMDSQPERFKDFGKRLDVFWDGDSVFYRGTVTAYSTTTHKHTILYDDNDVERVNLEVRRTACNSCFLVPSLSCCTVSGLAKKTVLKQEAASCRKAGLECWQSCRCSMAMC